MCVCVSVCVIIMGNYGNFSLPFLCKELKEQRLVKSKKKSILKAMFFYTLWLCLYIAPVMDRSRRKFKGLHGDSKVSSEIV